MSDELNKYIETGKLLSGESDSADTSSDKELNRIWNAAGNFKYEEIASNDSSWTSFKSRIAHHDENEIPVKVTWLRKHITAVAASAAILLAGTFSFWYFNNQHTENRVAIHIATGNNEIKTVDLEDGSRAVLNSNSSILISAGFNSDNRRISMSGEVDFEVSRNEKLPFVVDAGKTLTKVLGTGFDIKAYPGEDVNIYVKHGKVSFGSGNTELLLEKGNAGHFFASTGKLILTEKGNLLPWQNGEWVFKSTPVSEIAVMIKHRFGRILHYSESDANREFTGKFSAGTSADDIVSTIKEALQIELTLE